MDEQKFLRRVITRRQVLKTGVAAAGGLVLAACGPTASPQETQAPVQATVPPTSLPQAAGDTKLLRAAIIETSEPWDPARYYGTAEMVVPLNTQEGLVRYKIGTYEFEPMLAESWEIKDGAKAFTFNIRQGVKYHDGTTVNAEGIKYELERAMTINEGPAWLLTDYVDTITVDSEYQVTVNLKQATPDFLHNLAGPWAIRFQSPTAYQSNEKDGDLGRDWAVTNEAGTGPYKIETFEKESRVVLAKNEDYWRGWDGNHIEQAIISVIKEGVSARLQLEAGDQDVILMPLQPSDYDALSQNPNIEIGKFSGGNQFFLYFKCDKPPTDNKLVRQALSYAFNYDQVIAKVYGGYAERIGPLLLGLEGDSPDIHTHYQFDLDKAKQLLAEAGYGDGLKLKGISVATAPRVLLAYQVFQSDLKTIGVELDVTELSGAAWREQRDDPNADWQMFANYWAPDLLQAAGSIYVMYRCEGRMEKGAANAMRYCNEEADGLFQETLVEPDAAKRVANMQRVAQILLDEAPALWMYWPQDVWPYRKVVQNFQYNGFYTPWSVRIYDLSKEA
jgi:peptide/nickel transport system substrate-binding protein